MFSNNSTIKSTETYLENIGRIKTEIKTSDAIVIGAGAGLSTAAGLVYGGERFKRYFADYIKRYQLTDMYSAGFYPFATLEEHWAYWSKHIYHNRYTAQLGSTYKDLLSLVDGKNYFVITTNADHAFLLNGFSKQRLFYTQGDYGLFQCSVPCHQKTYNNKEAVFEMVAQQKDFKIPSALIPYCPRCGEPMTENLRKDRTFVEDDGWHSAHARYESFIKSNEKLKVLYLELGVGANTPGIIKYPFWQLVNNNKNATYACINLDNAVAPKEIQPRSILIASDIAQAVEALKHFKNV